MFNASRGAAQFDLRSKRAGAHRQPITRPVAPGTRKGDSHEQRFPPDQNTVAAAATEWPLAGVRAIRSGADYTYSLVRTALDVVSDGTEESFPLSGPPAHSEDTIVVLVDGSAETNYTIAAGVLTFDEGYEPGAEDTVVVKYTSIEGTVPAGVVTFFDVHKRDDYGITALIFGAEATLEVM